MTPAELAALVDDDDGDPWADAVAALEAARTWPDDLDDSGYWAAQLVDALAEMDEARPAGQITFGLPGGPDKAQGRIRQWRG